MEQTYPKDNIHQPLNRAQRSVPSQQVIFFTYLGCTAIALIYSLLAFMLGSTVLLVAFVGLLLSIVAGLFFLREGKSFAARALLVFVLNAIILCLAFLPIPNEVIPLLFFNLVLLAFVFFNATENTPKIAAAIFPFLLLLLVIWLDYPKVTTPAEKAISLSKAEKSFSAILLLLNFGLLFYFLKIGDRLKIKLRLRNAKLQGRVSSFKNFLDQKGEALDKTLLEKQRLQQENEEQYQQLIDKEIAMRQLTDEAERIRLKLRESEKASAEVFEQVGHLLEESHINSEMLQVQEDVLKANLDIQKFASEQMRIAHIEQQKFAAMVENSSDLIALFDFEGNFLYLNKTGREILGIENDQKYRNKNITELFFGREDSAKQVKMQQQLAQIGRWHGELCLHNQQADLLTVMDAAVFTVYDSNSEKPICRATVQRDITEKKKVENDLKQAYQELQHSELKIRKNSDKLESINSRLKTSKKQLEQALKREEESKEKLAVALSELKATQSQLVQAEKMASLGQLTAGIAHEINNPINFVYAGTETLTYSMQELMKIVEKYAELKPGQPLEPILAEVEQMKEEFDFPELKNDIFGLISDIMVGAVRTSEIVKGLRNFSRLDEHSTKLANIEEGIDSTLVLLKNQLKDRITVHRHKGGLPETYCYPGQLNQVFMNILTNAVQAIREEGNIWIGTSLHENEIRISIKDDGVGMNETVREKIFEPFFTTKEVGKGTGLGMSISYGIIQKHGGRIEVKSEPGVGSEFNICIPVKREKA